MEENTISHFFLDDNPLGLDGSIEVAKMLIYDNCQIISHNHLRLWDLKDNEIDDQGVFALMEYLPTLFPCLGPNAHKIQLDNNLVSDETLECLQGEQKKREKVDHQRFIIKCIGFIALY